MNFFLLRLPPVTLTNNCATVPSKTTPTQLVCEFWDFWISIWNLFPYKFVLTNILREAGDDGEDSLDVVGDVGDLAQCVQYCPRDHLPAKYNCQFKVVSSLFSFHIKRVLTSESWTWVTIEPGERVEEANAILIFSLTRSKCVQWMGDMNNHHVDQWLCPIVWNSTACYNSAIAQGPSKISGKCHYDSILEVNFYHLQFTIASF